MRSRKWMAAAVLFFCLLVLLYPQTGAVSKRPSDEQLLLSIEASVSPARLSRGQEGKVILNISPQEGIFVNSQPYFTVELDPSDELAFPKNFFSATDLEMGNIEMEGINYLNLEEPIEIPFTVSLEASRGNHTLEGKVKFFAFSKKDGAVVKTATRFQAAFYTRGS
jgi:hypothetical protein